MPHLEILIGMIGSGKSTYARKRASEGALIVSHDALTEMLHGEYRYDQSLRLMYQMMEESLVSAAFCCDKDVVIDRTHLTRESRARWRKAFPRTRLIGVTFKIELPHVHARRRFDFDDRGRQYVDWLKVAEHHFEQSQAEPFNCMDEGFNEETPA